MKKLFVLFAILFATSMLGVVAQPKIRFDKQQHDFGNINEFDGKVTHTFRFVNAGNDSLFIKNVRTSCGCTKPIYPINTIAPGDSGCVEITFDPSNRPGEFSKPIYVYANTIPERTILRIIGVVERPAALDSARNYTYRIGDVGLKTLHLSYKTIAKGHVVEKQLDVINLGKDSLSPIAVDVPSHIMVTFDPPTLQPGEVGKMRVVYNPDAIDDWGFRRDEFDLRGTTVQNDEATVTFSTITVSATLQEDFDNYTEQQIEEAPILVVGQDKVDFKVITGTKKVRREIYVVNAGFSPLEIHKINCDNEVLKATIEKNRIRPGQSTKLIIEIDPLKVRTKTMTTELFIVSNAPTNPRQSVRVTAEFQ